MTKMKWNESDCRPLLCTYRLNWARRTSWGWWDDTALQTQDSKSKPWRSEAEHATSRSRRLPTIPNFGSGWGRNIFVFYKQPRPGTEPRTLAWKAAVHDRVYRGWLIILYPAGELFYILDFSSYSNVIHMFTMLHITMFIWFFCARSCLCGQECFLKI